MIDFNAQNLSNPKINSLVRILPTRVKSLEKCDGKFLEFNFSKNYF